MRKRKIDKSVKFLSKKTCIIDPSVQIGKNVVVYGNNQILGNTKIGDNCIIYPNNYICDCEIGDETQIEFSHIKGAIIGESVHIGPYSRIRENTFISNNCKIGDFVEIKNSSIGASTKISHLAYVGDCDMGERCNVGCGAIFVNYNGKEKNRIRVGNNCFIGSNRNIIAPVNINNNCYICAGTTVTNDLNEFDFAIGRVRQEVKPRRAISYLKYIY